MPLEITPNGYSSGAHEQHWQHNIDYCPVSASTTGKPKIIIESRSNLCNDVPKTGSGSPDISNLRKFQQRKSPKQSSKHIEEISSTGGKTGHTNNASGFPIHHRVESNEKDFMAYLEEQAIQHESADDSEYEVVRCREVCILIF